jgi:hypothetical protein
MSNRAPDPSLLKSLADKAEKTRRFFSNDGKKERERWVVEHWAAALGRSIADLNESEAPDFVVDGEDVEVVEVLPPERRRGDEYKADRNALAQGGLPEWKDWVSFEVVQAEGHKWIADAISAKAQKYRNAAKDWTLVVYANYGWWEETDWDAVGKIVQESVETFAGIHVLGAEGEAVVRIKS